jgi:hypothetical protein
MVLGCGFRNGTVRPGTTQNFIALGNVLQVDKNILSLEMKARISVKLIRAKSFIHFWRFESAKETHATMSRAGM